VLSALGEVNYKILVFDPKVKMMPIAIGRAKPAIRTIVGLVPLWFCPPGYGLASRIVYFKKFFIDRIFALSSTFKSDWSGFFCKFFEIEQ
jgi:hypothetical protein